MNSTSSELGDRSDDGIPLPNELVYEEIEIKSPDEYFDPKVNYLTVRIFFFFFFWGGGLPG